MYHDTYRKPSVSRYIVKRYIVAPLILFCDWLIATCAGNLENSSANMEYLTQHCTNVNAHLLIVFYCRDFIKCACWQKVDHIENNCLGRWLNANLNGQFVIATWRIRGQGGHHCFQISPPPKKKTTTQTWKRTLSICFLLSFVKFCSVVAATERSKVFQPITGQTDHLGFLIGLNSTLYNLLKEYYSNFSSIFIKLHSVVAEEMSKMS